MAIGRTNAVIGSTIKLEELTIDLSMGEGNQIITPAEGKALSKVVITRPSTFLAANIKKGVNIGGVVGTLDTGGPSKGIEFYDYDADGYPHGLRIAGMIELPANYLVPLTNSGFTSKLETSKIDLSNITTVGYHSLNTTGIQIEIPSNIKYFKTNQPTLGDARYLSLADRTEPFTYDENTPELQARMIDVRNYSASATNCTFDVIANTEGTETYYTEYLRTPSDQYYMWIGFIPSYPRIQGGDIIINPNTKCIAYSMLSCSGGSTSYNPLNSFTYIQDKTMDINKFSIFREFAGYNSNYFFCKNITLNFRSRSTIYIGYNIYTEKFVLGDQITQIEMTTQNSQNIHKLKDSATLDIYLEAPQVVKVNNVLQYPLGPSPSQSQITHIYVPANLVDAYKTDTTSKWNTYADLIFPIPTE